MGLLALVHESGLHRKANYKVNLRLQCKTTHSKHLLRFPILHPSGPFIYFLSLIQHFLMPSPLSNYNTSDGIFGMTEERLFYSCTTSSTSAEDLNIHYAPPSKASLKIGVLVLSQDQTQLVDFAALDLLAMVGRNRLSKFGASDAALDEAVDEIDVRYVTSNGEGSFPVTSGGRIPVTVSFSSNCYSS